MKKYFFEKFKKVRKNIGDMRAKTIVRIWRAARMDLGHHHTREKKK